MALGEVQEKAKVFEASNDVLCFGLGVSELDYLSSINVEGVVVGAFDDCKEIGLKFNVMVVALDISVFRVFGIIERHMDVLLNNARILVRFKIDADVDDVKNVVSGLSRPLNLQPEQYVRSDDGIWLILSRL